MKLITLGELSVRLIWFDSMGAKSSCILVETPDIKILVDPGTAEMQPSYPLPYLEKDRLREEALEAIKEAAQEADTVFISHYHYDHHTLPLGASEIYRDKRLWIKDPNLWVNRAQWGRARLFVNQLYQMFEGKDSEKIYQPPGEVNIEDPLEKLPLALSRDFGDYKERKKELLKKGRRWFNSLAALWRKEPWVSQFQVRGKDVLFVDGKQFTVGST